MRLLKPLLLVATVATASLLTSFLWYPRSSEVDGYKPIFMKRADLESSVHYADARKMANPGKIWTSGTELFIVERYRGIHIVDNSDIRAPKTVGFIVAPGCIDVAVKDRIVYLDNAVDLVAFSLDEHREVGRKKAYFPEPASPSGKRYHHRNSEEDMIVVEWKKGKTDESQYHDIY